MTFDAQLAQDIDQAFPPEPPSQWCYYCNWTGDWYCTDLRGTGKQTCAHCPECGERTVDEAFLPVGRWE